ncbi:MAG: tRNA (adenosine(37)-N6)-dimethylallyltransferase MiaA [Lachnospiraceae bacterium]|nr:tRNA (adenosine(37)-N6)-dimethylallyltransferase MiaA [Lachnospiraceae bacterium]
MNDKSLIVLAGPTAVGKTALSINLAKALNAEIISADSVQVYKKLDIGSAKITQDEMDGVTHHLIDVLEPDEDFNVALFKDLVKEAIDKVHANGHIPILAGGTGFYIQAVLKDVDFTKGESSPEIRERLEAEAEKLGNEAMHDKLKGIDPESAEAIPAGNLKRVIRALEYYELTGEKISVHNASEKDKESPYDYRYFVLNDDRDKLYERIDRRVDIMMQNGLLDEVRMLKESGISRDAVSMQSLGYRQIMDYLYGNIDLDEAVFQVKLQTRHFAKRQLTWFRREKDTIWVNRPEFNNDESKMLEFMIDKCREIL